MIIPEHRACDICGQPVYGDLQHERIRKIYFEVKKKSEYFSKEYIRSSDIDICESCWTQMKLWVRQHLKEEDGNT